MRPIGPLSLVALAIASAACGTPISPAEQLIDVLVQGSVGPYEGVDRHALFTVAEDMPGTALYEGDVVVDDEGHSVYLSISVTNAEQLPVDEELHLAWNEAGPGGALVDVYACPNDVLGQEGEPVSGEIDAGEIDVVTESGTSFSGSADELFVTRHEDGGFDIAATAASPLQNLALAFAIEAP